VSVNYKPSGTWGASAAIRKYLEGKALRILGMPVPGALQREPASNGSPDSFAGRRVFCVHNRSIERLVKRLGYLLLGIELLLTEL
jgi:hypothetical protein